MGPMIAGIIALITALVVSPSTLIAQELTPKTFFEQLEGNWEEIKAEGSTHHYYLSFRLKKDMLIIAGHGSSTAADGERLHGKNDDKLFFDGGQLLKNRRVGSGAKDKIIKEPAALLMLNPNYLAYTWIVDQKAMLVETIAIEVLDEETLLYSKTITENGELIVERLVKMGLK